MSDSIQPIVQPIQPAMQPQSPSKKTGFATAALVLGIIALIFAFIPLFGEFIAIPAGALAVIFGIIGIVKKAGGLAITGLVTGILAIILSIVMAMAVYNVASTAINQANQSLDDLSGDNTEELLKTDVNVTFGKFSVDSDGFTTNLPVTVKNISSEEESYIITVEATDADGNQITTTTVMVNNLSAGQSTTQNGATLITSDQYDAMKAATFKVKEINLMKS